jgi:hypothetical protein
MFMLKEKAICDERKIRICRTTLSFLLTQQISEIEKHKVAWKGATRSAR